MKRVKVADVPTVCQEQQDSTPAIDENAQAHLVGNSPVKPHSPHKGLEGLAALKTAKTAQKKAAKMQNALADEKSKKKIKTRGKKQV